MSDITKTVPEDIATELSLKLGSWRLIKTSDAYTDKVGGYNYHIIGPNYFKISSWELVQMIHCCGICVSTSAMIYDKYRGMGLGTLLNKLRIHLAAEAGYGCLMCTDIDSNIPQRKILAKNGWKDVHSFTNPRTGNVIHISLIDLKKGEQ